MKFDCREVVATLKEEEWKTGFEISKTLATNCTTHDLMELYFMLNDLCRRKIAERRTRELSQLDIFRRYGTPSWEYRLMAVEKEKFAKHALV